MAKEDEEPVTVLGRAVLQRLQLWCVLHASQHGCSLENACEAVRAIARAAVAIIDATPGLDDDDIDRLGRIVASGRPS